MDPTVTAALTGGLAGSIFSLIGSFFVQKHFASQSQKQEVCQVCASIIQDIDGLIESFESLFADAAALTGPPLAAHLKTFKFIEPVAFGHKYKLRNSPAAGESERIDHVRYALRDIRQAHEAMIDAPPAVEATEHWSDVQAFLGDLANVRVALEKLV